ncbi:MAG: PhnD/SsuA/transferrin family substrate-binding protein [Cyanobacteria bacterium P01_H01_bin.35]
MKRRNFIWYILLFITSCSATTNNNTASSKIANKPEILRFAVTDVVGEEKLSDYEPFRVLLEEVLATKIEFFPVESYIAATAALQLHQVDLVLAGPSEYVVINARTNAIPLIGITRPNYHSVIVVNADSPIKSVAQLKGKSIAMSYIGSTGGHLGVTKLLMEAELDPKSDLNIQMLGDDGSLESLKQRKVDAWGGSTSDYDFLLRTEKASENDFPILAKSALLPSDVIIVRNKLDSQVVEEYKNLIINNQEQLVIALARGKSTKKYNNSELVLVNDADYDLIRHVYKAIGEGDLISQ